MLNPHLAPQLDAFSAQENPGHAVLVTAPWGAGKTFAVKTWLEGKVHLYVSLFGLDSAAAIENALFSAMLDGAEKGGVVAKITDGVLSLISGLIKEKSGVTFDMTGMVRNRVLANAPKLLVLDDLERAQMPLPILLSVINRLVEHDGKSVILIANEAELEGDDPSEYRRWREKLVGRTITLLPERDAALSSILGGVLGEAKDFLTSHQALLLQVFDASAVQNLRILRQSLTEFAAVFARIPDAYRCQPEPMQGLFVEYLALSFAWHTGGQLQRADFENWPARRWKPLVERNEQKEEKIDGYSGLQSRHKHTPFVSLDGRHLTEGLARAAIIDGYASDAVIAHSLAGAQGFEQAEPIAWKKLWWWRHNSKAQIETAMLTVAKQLDDHHFTDHAEILHVFGIYLSFAKVGILTITPQDVVANAKAYIDRLLIQGRLLPIGSPYRTRMALNQEEHGGLGFAERDTSEFQSIKDHLRSKLDEAQRSTRAARLGRLMDLLKTDLAGFQSAIAGRRDDFPFDPSEPIFLADSPQNIANMVFALTLDHWRVVLNVFEGRAVEEAQTREKDRESEIDWLLDFRAAALDIAAKRDRIPRAQIESLTDAYLGKLTQPDHDPSRTRVPTQP